MKSKIMGILNITPDSCFDQGRWFDQEKAIRRAFEIEKQGADILDIGGESTRPDATPVSEEEELKRVIPVIRSIKAEGLSIPISIDTMKPRVAEEALLAGASWINDITGFSHPDMKRVAKESNAMLVVMHMQGTPQTMQKNPHYPGGVIPCLIEWFKRKIDELNDAGIEANRLILDPGIGFGKTIDDNHAILHHMREFKSLGFPVLLGLSRKSFLGKIIGKTYPDLLPVTLAASTLALEKEVDYLRVHDVAEHHEIRNLINYFSLALSRK